MNPGWAHIVLVHGPVVGFPIILVFCLIAIKQKQDWLFHVCLGIAFLLGGMAIVAYLEGPPAYDYLKASLQNQPLLEGEAYRQWVDQVELHALIGRVYFLESVILLLLVIIKEINLLQGQQSSRAGTAGFVILLGVLSFTGAITAHEGGKIRRVDLWMDHATNLIVPSGPVQGSKPDRP